MWKKLALCCVVLLATVAWLLVTQVQTRHDPDFDREFTPHQQEAGLPLREPTAITPLLSDLSAHPDADPVPDAPLPPVGRFRVRLVDDADGTPLADTRCMLLNIGMINFEGILEEWLSPDGENARFATTDADGIIELELRYLDEEGEPAALEDAVAVDGDALFPLPAGWLPVTSAAALGQAVLDAHADAAAGPFEIRLRRPPAIRGRVVDASGTPVPGATVRCLPMADVEDWFAYTNGWRLLNSEGIYEEALETLPRAEAIAVKITEPAEIIGPAYNNSSNYFGGKGLEMGDMRALMADLAPSLATDADGRFELPAAPGRWKLYAAGHSHEPGFAAVTHADADSEVLITLGRALGSLRVHVRLDEKQAKAPIGFRISCLSPLVSMEKWDYYDECPFGWYGAFHARGRTELTLEFTGLPPMWLRVWADVEHSWEQQLLLEPGSRREVTLELRGGIVQLEFAEDLPAVDWINAVIAAEGRVRELRVAFEDQLDYQVRVPAGAHTFSILDTQYNVDVPAGGTATIVLSAELVEVQFTLGDDLAAVMAAKPSIGLYGGIAAHVDGPIGEDWFHIEDFVNGRATMRVQPGRYGWSLKAGDARVAGEIDLRHERSVRFSLDDLPGLARLDVHTPGSDDSLYLQVGNPYGVRLLGRVNGGVLRLDTDSWAVFAPPGIHQLRAISSKQRSTHELVFPGSTTIRFDDELAVVTLNMNVDGSSVASSPGRAIRGSEADPLSNTLHLPPGAWTIYFQPVNRGNPQVWRGVINGDVVLDPSMFEPLPPTSNVRLTFNIELAEPGLESVRAFISTFVDSRASVRRLDAPFDSGQFADEWRNWADWESAGLRIIVTGELPPGRYEVTPWPSAPERHKRTFTVHAEDVKLEFTLR